MYKHNKGRDLEFKNASDTLNMLEDREMQMHTTEPMHK